MTWILLIAAIASEVAATLSLKASQTTPAFYAVVVLGYFAAFTLIALVLKRGMGLGIAYGIWAASGVALTAALSSIIFAEAFTPLMGIGIVLIMAGVVLVETGSPSHTATATEKA